MILVLILDTSHFIDFATAATTITDIIDFFNTNSVVLLHFYISDAISLPLLTSSMQVTYSMDNYSHFVV